MVYTVENGKIKIKNFDSSEEQQEFIKVYDNRLPDISFLTLKGSLQNKTSRYLILLKSVESFYLSRQFCGTTNTNLSLLTISA